jgi:hypothetical protein
VLRLGDGVMRIAGGGSECSEGPGMSELID